MPLYIYKKKTFSFRQGCSLPGNWAIDIAHWFGVLWMGGGWTKKNPFTLYYKETSATHWCPSYGHCQRRSIEQVSHICVKRVKECAKFALTAN